MCENSINHAVQTTLNILVFHHSFTPSLVTALVACGQDGGSEGGIVRGKVVSASCDCRLLLWDTVTWSQVTLGVHRDPIQVRSKAGVKGLYETQCQILVNN